MAATPVEASLFEKSDEYVARHFGTQSLRGFGARNLAKAGYAANPLTDGAIQGEGHLRDLVLHHRVVRVGLPGDGDRPLRPCPFDGQLDPPDKAPATR